MLPKPVVESIIYEFYRVNKIHWVKYRSANPIQWNDRLERLNAELGYRLQGDSRLVVVNAASVSNPDEYALTLKAYWQMELFDKDMLSKNEVVFILGVASDSVVWVKAFTGMPDGNEFLMRRVVSEIQHKPFVIDSVLGEMNIVYDPVTKRVTATGVNAMANIMLENAETRYVRSHMEKYKYLLMEVDLTTGQKVGIFVITLLITVLVWGIPIAVGDTWEGYGSYTRSYYSRRY
jgi:hypothetical protein